MRKDTLKEIQKNLENVLKDLTREVNNEAGFIQKMVGGDKKSSLKQTQSLLSKTINMINNSEHNDSEQVGKIQNHLNDRDQKIKELETKFEKQKDEIDVLRNKNVFQENEINRLKSSPVEATSSKPITDNKTNSNADKLVEEYQNRMTKLEESNKDLNLRYQGSREELLEAQTLSVELSNRLKRLKTEVTSH